MKTFPLTIKQKINQSYINLHWSRKNIKNSIALSNSLIQLILCIFTVCNCPDLHTDSQLKVYEVTTGLLTPWGIVECASKANFVLVRLRSRNSVCDVGISTTTKCFELYKATNALLHGCIIASLSRFQLQEVRYFMMKCSNETQKSLCGKRPPENACDFTSIISNITFEISIMNFEIYNK